MVDLDDLRRRAETMYPDDVLAILRELRALRELERVVREIRPFLQTRGQKRALAAVDRARGHVHIDESAGEWRCLCPSDPDFDTSANPRCVSACTKCGATRPAAVDAARKEET